ncbi:GtrA family protein [Streptosporangium roseum]|uniref:GtrA family protein n=1 Tax=Streptosporangium roseum TaxID=2001 RepID=UPI0004CD8FF0|nr:GtrA family protein [Streptosporangium roseum]
MARGVLQTRAVRARGASPEPARSGGRTLLRALGDQRVVYLMAGAVTAVVYYALLGLGLLVARDRIPYVLLLVACQFVTSVIVYPGYRLMVFRASGKSWLAGYLRFYTVGLGFLVASVVGVPVLVELAGIPIMVAQGLIIVVNPPLSYVAHRIWTFRDRGKI